MQQTPQGGLAARVQSFADDKKRLEDGMANLELQYSKLATLRHDVEAISAGFGRALDTLADERRRRSRYPPCRAVRLRQIDADEIR